MSASCHLLRRLWPAVWALLWATSPAYAAPALLTIGHGWTWVREFFPPSGDRDVSEIVWTNPPAQIDLDTLQVWNVRRPWPVREWRWVDSVATTNQTPSNPPLVWRPHPLPAPPPVRNQLQIIMAEPLSDIMGHALTYRLSGFDWRAFYRVTVRGIGPQSIEAVQIDLSGYLRIQNRTSAAYPEARISLVGADESRNPPPKPFGLLDLNPDTPLTDLWLAPQKTEPLIPFVYPLQTDASIPADGQAEIQFARVVRKPAQIIHVCDSDEIPAPTPTGGLPLRRKLLVANTSTVGLGFPLPPGDADLFLGPVPGAPFQSGRVTHTPFPGTLELDMGTVDTVRASRMAGDEVPLPEGAWQADYSIQLMNNLASPIRVLVLEKPATPMQWNLVRSSVPCSATSRALNFDLSLPPQSTKTITYRLRLVARNL